jgi:hypothetical protein
VTWDCGGGACSVPLVPRCKLFSVEFERWSSHVKIVKSEVAFFAITLIGHSKDKAVSTVIDE